MEDEVSPSNFSTNGTDMDANIVLTKKVDELLTVVSGLVDANKNRNKNLSISKKQVKINDSQRGQERYTSREYVTICNPPFVTQEAVENVLPNTL